jgi:hypothetical protein
VDIMARKLYGKAVRNGWIVVLLGALSVAAGFILADKSGNMGYYSLVMLGVLFIITGAVIAGAFSKLEHSVERIVNDASPLLHYTASVNEYGDFPEAEAGEIRQANKTSLYIALSFVD